MLKALLELYRLFLSPLIWLLRLIYIIYPKKNHVICGSWLMKKTSDNSYEFHKNSSLNTFFISKEKKQIHPWSIKGIHIHLSSKFAIVCSGKGDINKYLFHGN